MLEATSQGKALMRASEIADKERNALYSLMELALMVLNKILTSDKLCHCSPTELCIPLLDLYLLELCYLVHSLDIILFHLDQIIPHLHRMTLQQLIRSFNLKRIRRIPTTTSTRLL